MTNTGNNKTKTGWLPALYPPDEHHEKASNPADPIKLVSVPTSSGR